MNRSRVCLLAAVLATTSIVAGIGATAATSHRSVVPTRGGHLTIDRREDSQSFDLTDVFQNESIWPGEQIMEPLYVNTPDGKSLRPWLATSFSVSNSGTAYTFHLRPGVRFSNGQPMTSADVKFSIDQSRAATKGWGYIDQAIKSVAAPNPQTVQIRLKFKWAPFLSDISTFSNAIVPKGYLGQTKAQFYKHPVGTGPFMWDKRVVGQSVTLKRNPYYWQKGKPFLDGVTFNFVSDDNTRQLQLLGGQAQIDEFPPFNSITKLQHTGGVVLKLFPSTRTDYLLMNEHYAPFADVHVRRALSYALDRAGIVKSVLFGFGKPANSFIPPGLPCYSASAPGLQYNIAMAKAELAKSKFPQGFKLEMVVAAGDQVHQAIGQILQQAVKPLGIDMTNQLGISYWQNDNIDPDELATFAVDPNGGANSWFTGYSDPKVTTLVHEAQHQTNPGARCKLYAKMQAISAQDAFSGFLYYSPFPYAYSDKVHGFFVSPLGNFHLEDVWLG